MFPTTLWSTIREAAVREGDALERFAERYRPPILAFLRSRGFSPADADDICQDVFARLLAGEVLAKADPDRGRLRSLLLAVTMHVIGDHKRRGRRRTTAPLDHETVKPTETDPDFDAEWVLHVTETAFAQLLDEFPAQYEVLCEHLLGQRQERRRLWRARRKLVALIRRQIALTCASHHEFEREVRYLNRYMSANTEKFEQNRETITHGPRSVV